MEVTTVLILFTIMTAAFVKTNVLVDYIVLRWIKLLTGRHGEMIEIVKEQGKSLQLLADNVMDVVCTIKKVNDNVLDSMEQMIKAQQLSAEAQVNAVKGLLNVKLGSANSKIESQIDNIGKTINSFETIMDKVSSYKTPGIPQV